MASDAQLYKANLEAARSVVEAGSPDGSATRLKAHGIVLRSCSLGQGLGETETVEYIAGALADICLAVTDERHACEQLLAMADVFAAQSHADQVSSNVDTVDMQRVLRIRSIVWQEAENMLRQVAAGENKK